MQLGLWADGKIALPEGGEAAADAREASGGRADRRSDAASQPMPVTVSVQDHAGKWQRRDPSES
jgi:hypothetical protein